MTFTMPIRNTTAALALALASVLGAAPASDAAPPSREQPAASATVSMNDFCLAYKAAEVSCVTGTSQRAGKLVTYGARDAINYREHFYPLMAGDGGCTSVKLNLWGRQVTQKLRVITTAGTKIVTFTRDRPAILKVDLADGPFRIQGWIAMGGRIYIGGTAQCAA